MSRTTCHVSYARPLFSMKYIRNITKMAPFPHIFSYECFNECMYEGFVRNSICLATGELNSNVSYHMPCLEGRPSFSMTYIRNLRKMAPFPCIFSYKCFNECTYEGFVRNSIPLATGELNSDVSYHMPCMPRANFVLISPTANSLFVLHLVSQKFSFVSIFASFSLF